MQGQLLTLGAQTGAEILFDHGNKEPSIL